MWAKVGQKKFDDLFVSPKPTILFIHNWTNRRIAVSCEVPGREWEQVAWLIPFMNTPGGRFDGTWYPLWEGAKMLTLPKEELVGCTLEVRPRPPIKSITVTLYESFLNDEFSIDTNIQEDLLGLSSQIEGVLTQVQGVSTQVQGVSTQIQQFYNYVKSKLGN
ncbi:hypothetical protein [Anabaena sp. PCC 7108]|uniref:hypothetical protein n=1 Tax=Anabaena sp. PCC 7108 TaxID=163908 RepID=UPI000377E92F|nr:hypothetical protein [Anabaena sp. PCC 7108]